jgi:PBSX family phage portal protein
MTIKIPVKKSDPAPVAAEQAERQRPAYAIRKIDPDLTQWQVPARAVVSNAFEPEDDFQNLYIGANGDRGVIQPPYDLRTLDRLCQENNTLGPCVEAMVVNVAGTGFDFVKDAPGSDENPNEQKDPKIAELWDFFTEPWPGESFVTTSKALRRDIERTGNGYLEFSRNLNDDIMLARHVDAKMMRLCKLDDPKPEKVTLRRKGTDVKVTVMKRYRRYVQVVKGVQLRYFKEFGCPLDLDKDTGKWAAPGQRVLPNKRATEILHFIDLPDAHTPYGVPKWIAELPSVLGSRKAEEFNLDFFDNGGIPPVIVFLQGGVLAAESRKVLEQKMSGKAQKKNRVQVIEMEPVGSFDSPNNSKVVVERFGSEKQSDSMFEKYDDKCEVRIRRGFRLPPIFLGQAADYSFATAFASYTVAEAQVFKPERDEFDEIISAKVLPQMGYKGYLMKSKPMQIEDATLKLQGLEIAQASQQIDAKDLFDALNQTVGLRLKVSTTLPVPQTIPAGPPIAAVPGGSQVARSGRAGIKVNSGNGKAQSNSETTKPKASPVRNPKVTKTEDEIEMLVRDTMAALQKMDFAAVGECFDQLRELDEDEALEVLAVFDRLSMKKGPHLVAAE